MKIITEILAVIGAGTIAAAAWAIVWGTVERRARRSKREQERVIARQRLAGGL